MNYKLHTLPNGIRLITVSMPSSESTTVTVWVRTGSRNEEDRVLGISHFLEHMVFKGGKRRPTNNLISEAIDSMGAENNAFTSKDWTSFYIKSQNSQISTAFDILSDIVINPVLDPKEMEKEKGTILQEMAMYEDMPMAKVGVDFEELIFTGSKLRRDIIGTRKTVTGITRADFVRYRDMHYYPENMVVSVAGGISEDKILSLAKKYFADFQHKPGNFRAEAFKSKQSKPQVMLTSKKSDQAHLTLGYLGNGRNYPGRYAQAVLSTILGRGMSSRLFVEVREKRGLAYAIKNSIERYQETGYMDTYIGTDPKKTEEAINVTLEEHLKIADKTAPISPKELGKAKEMLKGRSALSLEDTASVGDFFATQVLFQDEVLTPEQVYQKIDKVTLDEVYDEAKKLFKPEKLNLAIIGPFTDSGGFLKLLS